DSVQLGRAQYVNPTGDSAQVGRALLSWPPQRDGTERFSDRDGSPPRLTAVEKIVAALLLFSRLSVVPLKIGFSKSQYCKAYSEVVIYKFENYKLGISMILLSRLLKLVSMVKSRSQGHDTSSCYLNKMFWLNVLLKCYFCLNNG
ncbi:unnamed protein product, partial [Musa acuminata subsp. burmannicoides]